MMQDIPLRRGYRLLNPYLTNLQSPWRNVMYRPVIRKLGGSEGERGAKEGIWKACARGNQKLEGRQVMCLAG